MKRCYLWPLFCGLLLAAGPGNEIEGRVVNAVTGAPIARARKRADCVPATQQKPAWLC